LYGESKEKIAETIKNLNQPAISMPPWCGTDEELDALAEFLTTVRPAK
jgi:mono/diheme cytochrome c family protein